ncbi:MAG: tRNA lysidine(34) synthetase TilS [Clostridia bacterium]|nr:tRNA lysidine(34) synthetase TilS [Clostridia bacterium]
MDTKNKVLNYIKKHNLLKSGDAVICAVSGGADSVCMLEILKELQEELSLTLYIAHVNHQLRGTESDRDELFVQKLSKNSKIPFYCKRADVKLFANTAKLSCEEAGRIVRYDFFEELIQTLGANKIATAHNKNDNIETVLMRIMRGTDIKGLSGIPVHNDRDVIRPILCLSRSEIEDYLKCKGIDFVTDSTNLEDDFSRNKVRHNLIPMIENQFNENFVNVMSSNIELFGEANSFIEKKVNSAYESLIVKDDYVHSFFVPSLLREDSYIVKRIIKKAIFELAQINITNDLCNLIYATLTNGSSVSISKDLEFYVKYERAFFVKKHKIDNMLYNINSPGVYRIREISSVLEITEGKGNVDFSNKNTIYLKKDLFTYDFILRSRNSGDRMSLKNCGTKKIKDIFIDEKIPSFLKDEFPILEYNGKIIWLCGLRDDPQFRAKKNENYIKISLHKENNNE